MTSTRRRPIDVFISYEWESGKAMARKLEEGLMKEGYECWRDERNIEPGDKLYEKIDEGLNECKVVIACVTTKYTESEACNNEITRANNIRIRNLKASNSEEKPIIIPLFREKTGWFPGGSSGMAPILSPKLYVEWSDEKEVGQWKGDNVENLLKTLKKLIPAVDPPSLKKAKGVKLLVYYDDNFSPNDVHPELEKMTKYPWARFPHIKCHISNLGSGSTPFKKVKDALMPLFCGQEIRWIGQDRGSVKERSVARVTSPDNDEERHDRKFFAVDDRQIEWLGPVPNTHMMEEGDSVLLCGGQRRTVLSIYPEDKPGGTGDK